MTDPVTCPPKRRRGAQPGNTNALKHGLYSGRRRKDDPDRFTNSHVPHLDDEIDMLRILIRQVLAMSNGLSLWDYLTLLRTLSLASSSLTRLIKTNAMLDYDASTEPSTEPGTEPGPTSAG